MYSSDTHEIGVYLVFRNSDKWYLKILKEGFQHVCAVYPFDEGLVLVDPYTSHIGVSISNVADPRLLFEDSATIVPVSAKIDSEYVYCRMSFGTCVDTAKRLLGIKKLFIFTPYQLYRYLHGNV